MNTETQSPTISALCAALAKAQGAMEPAIKDKENPYFRSRYADLTGIWESIRKPLADNELSVVQTTRVGLDGTVILLTTLAHSSGEWIRGEYPITALKHDPQGIGSAVTYARRYALSAIAGACSEDDDGEAAHGRGKNQSKETFSVPNQTMPLVPEPLAPANTVFIYYSIERLERALHEASDGEEKTKKKNTLGRALAYLEEATAYWDEGRHAWKSPIEIPKLISFRL